MKSNFKVFIEIGRSYMPRSRAKKWMCHSERHFRVFEKHAKIVSITSDEENKYLRLELEKKSANCKMISAKVGKSRND